MPKDANGCVGLSDGRRDRSRPIDMTSRLMGRGPKCDWKTDGAKHVSSGEGGIRIADMLRFIPLKPVA